MKKILLTGFEPFGGEKINPSEAVLELLPDTICGVQLFKERLPVTYRESAALALDAFHMFAPDAVVMLGQAGGRNGITLERLAINLDHAKAADNAGETRMNALIHPDAPAAYFATLPMDAMLEAMHACSIPCSMSISAGAFICNHVSFEMLHHLYRTGATVLGGFIHLPYLPEQVEGKQDVPCMEVSIMQQRIVAALTALTRVLNKGDV